MTAIPSFPKGKPFDQLPSFEVLQQRSGLKVAKLRELLKDVPRFKCADNSVRYEDASATVALEGADPANDVDEAVATAVAEPLSQDPVQAALQVMNRTLSLFSVVVRERGEIVKLCNDTIRTMGDPMKLGQQLVQDNVAVLREEVQSYRAHNLDVLRLLQDLHDSKEERERKARDAAERSKFRTEAYDLAKRYVPDAIDKFQLTTEAGLAVELLRGLDPDALAPIVEHALPKELHPKAGKLIDILRARRDAAERRARVTPPEEQTPDQKGTDNGSGQTPRESTQAL